MIWGGTKVLPEKWLESCLTNQSFFLSKLRWSPKKNKKGLHSNWASFSVQFVVISKKKRGLHSNWAGFSVQIVMTSKKRKKVLHSHWDGFSVQRSEYFSKQTCPKDMKLPKILTQYCPKNMISPEILTQNRPKYMKLPKILLEIRTLYTNWGGQCPPGPPPPTPMPIAQKCTQLILRLLYTSHRHTDRTQQRYL